VDSSGPVSYGSPSDEVDRSDDETQHGVTLTSGFWLGQTTITQRQYLVLERRNPSYFREDPEFPVESISWDDAQNYCRKLSILELQAGRLPSGFTYTLPSEAQWEYACRANSPMATHFGGAINATLANFDGKRPYGCTEVGPDRRRTTRVGSFPANAWGLHDMHGNVWEWCQDWYAPLGAFEVVDPVGPAHGTHRVTRGGGWIHPGHYCRSALRGMQCSGVQERRPWLPHCPQTPFPDRFLL
jgi:formylglycine-generating enzyme